MAGTSKRYSISILADGEDIPCECNKPLKYLLKKAEQILKGELHPNYYMFWISETVFTRGNNPRHTNIFEYKKPMSERTLKKVH